MDDESDETSLDSSTKYTKSPLPSPERQSVTEEVTEEDEEMADATITLAEREVEEENGDTVMEDAESDTEVLEIPRPFKTVFPDDEDSSTITERRQNRTKHPPLNGLTPARKTEIRLSCRITIAPSTKPLTALNDALKDHIDWLKMNDPSMVCYPWKDSEQKTIKNRIQSSEDLPKIVPKLREFFDKKCSTRGTKGGRLYIHMRIGTNLKNFADFKAIQDGSAPDDYQLYEKDLQVEDTIEAGWLLYSHQAMNAETFKNRLLKDHGLKVGLRFRVISDGTFGSFAKRDPKSIVRAWHIEVNAQTARNDMKKLRKIFATDQEKTNYVEGKRMRLVPDINAVNLFSRETIAIRREKQSDFTKNCMKTPNNSMVALDMPLDGEFGTTLRDLIMAIPHPNPTKTEWSLFHSVDKQYGASFHNFTYTPTVHQEAAVMMISLLPYFRHKYPRYKAKIQECFTLGAIEAAETAEWDNERQCVVTAADKEVARIAKNATDDDEWVASMTIPEGYYINANGIQQVSAPLIEMENPTDSQMAAGRRMDESVSTMGSKIYQGDKSITSYTSRNSTHSTVEPSLPPSLRSTARSGHKKGRPPSMVTPASGSSIGKNSALSSEDTIDSRLSAMEARYDQVLSALQPLQQLQSQMNEFLIIAKQNSNLAGGAQAPSARET